MSLATNLNALVNQAAFTNMNMLAAQAQRQLLPQVGQPTRQSNSPPPGRNQRTFVGVVTKLMETYGFVDEDVFFQTKYVFSIWLQIFLVLFEAILFASAIE